MNQNGNINLYYYLDQFLLSASANKLYVHQIGGLDSTPTNGSDTTSNPQQKSPDDFWFKLAKTFPLPGILSRLHLYKNHIFKNINYIAQVDFAF